MTLTRREFLEISAASLVAISTGSLPTFGAEFYSGGTPNAERLGWRVGCQLYSFHTKSFREAVEMNASLGLKWAESYPGQKLTPDHSAAIGSDLSADDKKLVRTILADNGVTLCNFGVVEKADRKTFEFAKEMGIETLTAEPRPEEFDDVEKLVREFDVKIAIHNHPNPSFYWDYHKIMEVCAGRDARIGSCLDINHLRRSGLSPLQALRDLGKRVLSFHFGYLLDGEEVPLSKGASETVEIMKLLKQQGFQGVFAFEYEKNPGENLGDLAESVKFFNDEAKKL